MIASFERENCDSWLTGESRTTTAPLAITGLLVLLQRHHHMRAETSSSRGTALFFFFHGLANQRGVTGFGVDHGFRGHTTASHRVGIFLRGDYAVLDEFSGGWRLLAS
jgi:hypothetical protein